MSQQCIWAEARVWYDLSLGIIHYNDPTCNSNPRLESPDLLETALLPWATTPLQASRVKAPSTLTPKVTHGSWGKTPYRLIQPDNPHASTALAPHPASNLLAHQPSVIHFPLLAQQDTAQPHSSHTSHFCYRPYSYHSSHSLPWPHSFRPGHT